MGVNMWDEVLTFLAHYTDRNVYFSPDIVSRLSAREMEMRNLEYSIVLRLSAHIAIVLMLNGRIVNGERSMSNYNSILTAYLEELIVLKEADKNPRGVESVVFYISFLLGEQI
jgi:hypothetical protein